MMNGTHATQTEDRELFIDRPDVPYLIGQHALAAAQVIFDRARVEAKDAWCALNKREDWESGVIELTRCDEHLIELWEQADEAARALLRPEGLLFGEIDC